MFAIVLFGILFFVGLIPLALGVWLIVVDRAPGPESALTLKLPALLGGGEVNLKSGTGIFVIVLGIIMMIAAASGVYSIYRADRESEQAIKSKKEASESQVVAEGAKAEASKLKTAVVVQKNPEQQVVKKDKLTEPLQEGLYFLNHTAVTNLRTRLEVPPGKEKEKYSPVTRLLYSTLKRTEATAKLAEFEYGTTGVDIDVSCLSHPKSQLYQSLQPHKHGDVTLAHTYQLRVKVDDVPVNEPFGIVTAATYWNSFQGKDKEWAALVSPAKCDELVVVLLFDAQKPMKTFKLFAYPHNGKKQAYEGTGETFRSQDGTVFSWKVRGPKGLHSYEVEWEW
jgi:hypothetical protein